MLALVLTLSIATTASAGAPPTGGCPAGFTLHEYMHDHDHDPQHFHAGLKADLNADGMICMLEKAGSIHIHMDNVIVRP